MIYDDHILLMRQTTIKALNYANEIRKTQRKNILMQMRSKMLAYANLDLREEMEEDNPLPSTNNIEHPAPQATSQYQRILAVLTCLIRQQEKELKSGMTVYGCDIIEYILMRNDAQTFQFQNSIDQSPPQMAEMSMIEFRGWMNALPKLITQLITQININLTRISACKPEALRESYSVFKKVERCTEIRALTYCLNRFLSAYARVAKRGSISQKGGSMNYGLLEGVIDCLIEISCFKPKLLLEHQLHSQELMLLGKVINSEMQAFRQAINGELCQQLKQCIFLFREREQPLKLFTNYIYLIGNVFISIHARPRHQETKHHYDQLHSLVLQKFTVIMKEVQDQIATAQREAVIQGTKGLLEMGQLMLWFIRNQILIREGMFDGEKMTMGDNKEAVSSWLQVIFGVFDILLKVISLKDNSNVMCIIDPAETSLIEQAISLLKVIYFDFKMQHYDIHKTVEFLIKFRRLIQEIQHKDSLLSKILDFYFAIACDSNNSDLLENITEEAQYALSNQRLCPSTVRFAARLIQQKSKLHSKLKVNIFAKICSSMDSYINYAKLNPQEENIATNLFLIHSAARTQQHIQQISGQAFQLFNEKRIIGVLQLCGLLWEEDPKTENLIESLELLKLLADEKSLNEIIRQTMTSYGYDSQLENLSLNTNEHVNRLVYEISELLEIQ